MSTLFYNAQILTMTQSSPSLLRGAVGVIDKRIALVTQSEEATAEFTERHPEARKIDCCGKLLMPGLINTHTHVAMTLQRGTGDDTELMPWLNEIVWPFEALQSDDDIEAGARLGIAEMLLGGTTTFVDMYWSEHAIAKAVEQLGVRAVLGESCLEGRMDQFEENLPRLVACTAACDRISAIVSPHAPYTCPPAIMARCVELSEQHQLPIQTHLAETTAEVQTIRELYDKTPTKYLDDCGVIKPSTILAHSIYLSDEDINIINKRGAKVAHNPQCNMKISSGVAPIPALLAAGVTCSIGTDGVCSNNDLDMWDEMRTASFVHKLTSGSPTTLPAYQVLQMATVGGAKSIGREGELGVIAEGALADIILLNTNRLHYRPQHDLISSLVYCGKAADVECVMVNGCLLVEDYTLKGCDTEAISAEVERRSKAIFKLMGRTEI
ncbi:MAG: amidohydrolase [Rikenellaceae bacterium]